VSGPPSRTPADAEEYFIAAGLDVEPAAGGKSWVFSRGSGSVHLLDDSTSSLLPYLSRWRTIGGHARELEHAGLGALADGFTSEALRELARRGVLLPLSDFIAALRSRPSDGARPGVSVLSWCTHDRPEALRSSMRSFVSNAIRHGRRPRILVCDDSTDPQVAGANRAVLEREGQGLQASYLGSGEKRILMRSLIAEAPEISPAVLEFALFGLPGFPDTTGANHNALLLATAGRPVFNTDDDTLCECARLRDFDPDSWELSSAPDPTGCELFLSAQELRERVAFKDDADLLSPHEELVGACVGDLASAARTLRVDAMRPVFVETLLRRAGSVAVVASGICGDCGLADPRFLLKLSGSSRDRLMASEELYMAAAQNRLVLRAVPRLAVSGSTFLQAASVSLDNTRLLPPFPPVGRNCDGVFAQALRAALPDRFIAHLPFAVRHQPQVERSFAPGAARRMTFRLSEMVNVLVATWAARVHAASGPTALQDVGRFLVEVAALPGRDFLAFVRREYLAHLGRYAAELEEALVQHGEEPSFWAEDVHALLEAINGYPSRPDFCLPSDLPGAPGMDEALALCQRVVSRFGHLMTEWPSIMAAAQRQE